MVTISAHLFSVQQWHSSSIQFQRLYKPAVPVHRGAMSVNLTESLLGDEPR